MGAATAVKEEGTMHTSLYVETKKTAKASERARARVRERERERAFVCVCVCVH